MTNTKGICGILLRERSNTRICGCLREMINTRINPLTPFVFPTALSIAHVPHHHREDEVLRFHFAINYYRLPEPILLNRCCDLRHSPFIVAGVPGIGDQLIHFYFFNLHTKRSPLRVKSLVVFRRRVPAIFRFEEVPFSKP